MTEPTANDQVHLPRLFAVRVLTAAGPYEPGDTLALAFTVLGMARVLAHEPRRAVDPPQSAAITIPEALSAMVVHPAEPYSVDDVVILSFIDPSVARVHVAQGRDTLQPSPPPGLKSEIRHTKLEAAERSQNGRDAPRQPNVTGPSLLMRWTPDRIRRFVQVSDKLFTVDRLGWYRHSLALRLLLPDEVAGIGASDSAALNDRLQDLRSEATVSLGVPLLGALMPNFAVTPAWLDSFCDGATEQAFQAFRAAAERLEPTPESRATADDVSQTPLRDARLIENRPQSLEAALALLIPHLAANSLLTEALTAYRNDLIDLFEQMSSAAETVRLKAMSQPNHLLDERLWQLAGTVGELFGPLSVA